MGNLIDLNSQIPDSRIPAGIARDTETTAAINAHIVAVDPHPIYLTQAEGDGRYRQTATALTDADIPAAIARDVEVTAAVTAHVAAADPHPVYLTQAEGDGRYLGIEDMAENSGNLRSLLAPIDGVNWDQMRLGRLFGTVNTVSVANSIVAEYAQDISPGAIAKVLGRFDVVLNLPAMPPGFRQSFVVSVPIPIYFESAYQGFFIRNQVPNGERHIRIQPVWLSNSQITLWVENLSGVSLPAVASARIRVVMF
ncbi:hypothetical protein [Microcoleus sp. CAWBG640]|uniref:hypothetical protein n=1 Tax=Microcoleus sp. CAWBG640 TaxID=2841653 RepID=UPI00312BAC98